MQRIHMKGRVETVDIKWEPTTVEELWVCPKCQEPNIRKLDDSTICDRCGYQWIPGDIPVGTRP